MAATPYSFVGLHEALDVLSAAEELLQARLLEYEPAASQDRTQRQLFAAALARADEVAKGLNAMVEVLRMDTKQAAVRRTQLHSVSI